MSVMDKIFGAFKPGTPPAPAQPGVTNNLQNNPPPPEPHSSQQTAPNGVVPPGAKEGNKESPGDKFADLWQPPKQDEANKEQQTSGLTPEKMLEAAGKVDFKRVLDPENLAKIKAGGDEAVTALAELLNKTAQTVYGQSTVVAQKLVENAVDKARADFEAKLPNAVKSTTAREALLADNPAFTKPTVAPIVQAVQAQLQLKYPNATVAELNALAKEYIQTAITDLSPPKPAAKPAPGEVDWDGWVSAPVPSQAS